MQTMSIQFGEAVVTMTLSEGAVEKRELVTKSPKKTKSSPKKTVKKTKSSAKPSASKKTKKVTKSPKKTKSSNTELFRKMQSFISEGDYEKAKALVSVSKPEWTAQCAEAIARHSKSSAGKPKASKKAPKAKSSAGKPKASNVAQVFVTKSPNSTKFVVTKVPKVVKKKAAKKVLKNFAEGTKSQKLPDLPSERRGDADPASWLAGLDFPCEPTKSAVRKYTSALVEEAQEDSLQELERVQMLLLAAEQAATDSGAIIGAKRLRDFGTVAAAAGLRLVEAATA